MSCCLRMALAEAGYFGDAPDLQGQFDLAYDSFKAFCKAERIQTSQPPFKVNHATWFLYATASVGIWCEACTS